MTQVRGMGLIVAAFFEIVLAAGLKYVDDCTRHWPGAGVSAAMVASMIPLTVAARGLPFGAAYAVWTGIGAAGTVVAGILRLNESIAPALLARPALIVAGVIGLKMLGK